MSDDGVGLVAPAGVWTDDDAVEWVMRELHQNEALLSSTVTRPPCPSPCAYVKPHEHFKVAVTTG